MAEVNSPNTTGFSVLASEIPLVTSHVDYQNYEGKFLCHSLSTAKDKFSADTINCGTAECHAERKLKKERSKTHSYSFTTKPYSVRDWIRVFPSRTSIASEGARHLVVRTLQRSSMDIRGFFPSSNVDSSNASGSKRKGSDEGEASKSSGSSGKRKFVRSWTKGFPWLEYDGEKMQCKLCCSRTTESDSLSVFVTGSTNFKFESIRSHEKSNGHTRAAAAIKVAENPRLAPLPQVLLTICPKMLNRKWRDYLTLLILSPKEKCPLQVFLIFAILK